MTTFNVCQFKLFMRDLALIALCVLPLGGYAQPGAWKPDKAIELIAPSGPGGAVDLAARQLQRLLVASRVGDVSVVNKVGGAGSVGMTYLNSHPKDGHYLSLTVGNLLTNPIIGVHPLTYNDLTPIVLLSTDYILFAVRSDSPLKSGADIIARLKKDPSSVSFGLATALGGVGHMATAAAMRSVGVDIRKLKLVVFKSGGDATTALLGGHVDVAAAAPPALLPHIQAGGMRGIAIGAPARQSGIGAQIPTWKEQGAPGLVLNWRGIVGPKDLSAAQVTYWEDTLARVTETGEWKQYIEKTVAEPRFLRSAEFGKFLDEQSALLRSVLGDLGMVR